MIDQLRSKLFSKTAELGRQFERDSNMDVTTRHPKPFSKVFDDMREVAKSKLGLEK